MSTVGLDELVALRTLKLSDNGITELANLDTLKALIHLDLGGNRLTSLAGLEQLARLQHLDVHNNEIVELEDIKHILKLPSLIDTNFGDNALQFVPDYRLATVFRMQQLVTLDGEHVTPEEKVAAVDLFDPPSQVLAAVDHAMCGNLKQNSGPSLPHFSARCHPTRAVCSAPLRAYTCRMLVGVCHPTGCPIDGSRHMAAQANDDDVAIFASTPASADRPYPVVVLCGPAGEGKRQAQALFTDGKTNFDILLLFTSPPPPRVPRYFSYNDPRGTQHSLLFGAIRGSQLYSTHHCAV